MAKISQRVRTKAIFTSEANDVSEITTKSARMTIDYNLNAIEIQIADYSWLIIGKQVKTGNTDQQIANYIKQHNLTSQHTIIVSSEDLASSWLELLEPEIAIASSERIAPKTKQILQQKQIEFHNTAVETMIRWTPQQGLIQTQDLLN
ncbi:MAG: hypothetical protein HC775_20455 [Hyellaceae cyanobacterium CSU_1_1]|nr:hypothetical protein [Hyellaceae cyanobacterium CSU_1_1]